MPVEIHICDATGIALLPAAKQRTFRLAKPSYGVLNPQARGISSADDRTRWNRFDLPGEQTIYAASTPEGAYGELLGALKRTHKYLAEDYLDEVGTGDELYTLIAEDWAELGKKPPGVVDINWLYEHNLYELDMPTTGWFVDIEHARTITYLGQHLPVAVWERSITTITAAEIRNSDRYITTPLAETLAKAPIDGGTSALGIHYYSKHGTEWTCWAVWLRDDVATKLTANTGTKVASPQFNPPLAATLDTYNLSAG